jgi:hypothetical protein
VKYDDEVLQDNLPVKRMKVNPSSDHSNSNDFKTIFDGAFVNDD